AGAPAAAPAEPAPAKEEAPKKAPPPPSHTRAESPTPEVVLPAAAAPVPPPTPARSTEMPQVDGCHAYLGAEDGSERLVITATKAVLGRFDPVTGLKREVDLSNADINRSVSRRHARLNFEGGIYYLIEEPGALNGTFINGRKLITGKPTRVKDGDSVN